MFVAECHVLAHNARAEARAPMLALQCMTVQPPVPCCSPALCALTRSSCFCSLLCLAALRALFVCSVYIFQFGRSSATWPK